jgi:hypothetical protein
MHKIDNGVHEGYRHFPIKNGLTLYSAVGETQWRLGFEEDKSSRVCLGNKASCQMTFFSEKVRHLGTCPWLLVGMVRFITHLTISWGCIPTHPRDEGMIDGICGFIRTEVGFDDGFIVETECFFDREVRANAGRGDGMK